MKKIIILLLLAPLAISSCKKNGENEPNGHKKKYTVNFNVEGINKSTGEFKPSATPKTLGDDDDGPTQEDLYVRIYDLDNDGQELDNTLPARLSPGNYVAIFVVSDTWFYKFSTLGQYQDDGNLYEWAYFRTGWSVDDARLGFEDIFYKKIHFTITNKDINQSVVLSRLNAGLEVIFTDEIPPIVSTIEVTVEDAIEYNFYDDTREYSGEHYGDRIHLFSPGEPIKLNVLGLGGRGITIRAYDAADNILVETYTGATFYQNKRTTIKGKLLQGPAIGFTVTVNPTWDTPSPTVPF